jgi:hypothetical protein
VVQSQHLVSATAGGYVDVDTLEAGSAHWVHGTVSGAAMDEFAHRISRS